MEEVIKKKKYLLSIIVLFAFFAIFSVNNKIFAQENTNDNVEQNQIATVNSIFDIKGINGEYKTSSDASDIYLPFFRNAVGRIEVDKSLEKIGMLSSSSTIDVNESLKNIQFLLSSDTIRINANMEYALIWAANDVVINSNIERNVVIFAGGTVTIEENVTVGDDVIIIANNVNIKGTIKENVVISSSSVSVSGIIEKDLRCNISSIDISGNDNVKGNVYIITYNKDLNIKDKYKDATINIREVKNTAKTFGNILLKTSISSLVFTLLYLIVKKVSKGKVYEKMFSKSKNNTLFVILSGAISLLAFPAIFMLLILISILGLYMIAVPILVMYLTFLIVFVMLSVYVVGSTVFEYINKKYIKAEKLSVELVGSFFTFLSLNLLCKIPKVGVYIYMAEIMIAVGIMLAYFFKKDRITKEQEK